MEIPSLRPELGLELFKTILLRETYIKKLRNNLNNQLTKLDPSIVNTIDLLRETSVQVVETLDLWEKAQISYPDIKPFLWNGTDYSRKMQHDLDFLDDFDIITNWLGFPLIGNPFIIPSEIYSPLVVLDKQAYVVFGKNPNILDPTIKIKKAKPLFGKSPYTTPIINDPNVFKHLSAKSKLDKKFKKSKQSEEVPKEEEIDSGPYQVYISSSQIDTIKKCLFKIQNRSTLPDFSTSQVNFDSSIQYPLSAESVQFKESVTANSFENSAILNGSFDGFVHNNTQSLSHDNSIQFESNKDKFLNKLKSQTESRFIDIENQNESLRMNGSILSSKEVEPQISLHQSQLWTPHEIHLQKQVQRRGGELFILTAAGTKGRMKAPWRRTRFERMEKEYSHYESLLEQSNLVIEDIYSRLVHMSLEIENATPFVDIDELQFKFAELCIRHQDLINIKKDIIYRFNYLKDQLNHFKLVAEPGSLTDIEKQRQRHKMKEGQARLEDQQISMNLEDRMVRKIQLLVRRKYGKALRKAEMHRRELAALRIQSRWRMSRVGKVIRLRTQQIRLATMVTKLYRKYKASILRQQLQLEALHRMSTLLIQRVYRGYCGRRRLNLKRKFVRALADAKFHVSAVELKPGDVEELADIIEDYIRDYTLQLPIAYLSVLRGVLYLLNGENSECVIVNNDEGYTEKKFIHSSSVSWMGMKLILRRKGRFLRRVRALVQNSCLPNPTKIFLSTDCQKHLKEIIEKIDINEFNLLKFRNTKQSTIHLFEYLKSIYTAFELQDLFPEYFQPGYPSWFRQMMRIRELYDHAEIERKIEHQVQLHIEEIKRKYIVQGHKFNHIKQVIEQNRFELENKRIQYRKLKKRLKSYIVELQEYEMKQLKTLQEIIRTKELNAKVAESDLKEYINSCLVPDEEHLKSLQNNVDLKTILLIQSQRDYLNLEEIYSQFQSFRDFDRHFKMKAIYDFCFELGNIKGNLLVLLQSWNLLLANIGGVQYLKDLQPSMIEYDQYKTIQKNAIHLMQKRKDITKIMFQELDEQYKRLYQVVMNANMKYLDKKWDVATSVDSEYEEAENLLCCKRDYELEFRKRRQLELINVTTSNIWTPSIVIIDIKFPRQFLEQIEKSLKEFNFHHFNWHYFSFISDLTSLQYKLQSIIDEKKNMYIIVNRHFHQIPKSLLDNQIFSLFNVLIPRPRVICLSAEKSFSTDRWFEQAMFDRNDKSTNSELDQAIKAIQYSDEGEIILPKSKIEVSKSDLDPNINQSQSSIESKETNKLEQMEFNYNLLTRHNQEFIDYLKAKKNEDLYPTQSLFEEDSLYKFDMILGKSRKLGRYFRLILMRSDLIDNNISTSIKSSFNKLQYNLLTKLFPISIQKVIHSDFLSFLHSIKSIYKKFALFCQNPENINILYQPFMDHLQVGLTLQEMLDLQLALHLAIIWKVYQAPLVPWCIKELYKGIKTFRIYLSKVHWNQLCDNFENLGTYQSNTSNEYFSEINGHQFEYENAFLALKQIQQCESQFSKYWDSLSMTDYFVFPSRVMIYSWIQTATDFISLIPPKRQISQLTYDKIFYPSAQHIEDIISFDESRKTFIGELLHDLLEPFHVFENPEPIWKLYYDRNCMDSLTSQALGTHIFGTKNSNVLSGQVVQKVDKSKKLEKPKDTFLDNEEPEDYTANIISSAKNRKPFSNNSTNKGSTKEIIINNSNLAIQSFVYVYHYGEDILLELCVSLNPELLDDLDPKLLDLLYLLGLKNRNYCRYFTKLSNDDLIQLMQPNCTEIFEGKVKKLAINSFTNEDFYHLMTNWLSLDLISGSLHVNIIRTRFLILTKLGDINGYFVRLEIYEERFGEILILLFGLPSSFVKRINQNGVTQILVLNQEKDSVINPDDCVIHYLKIDKALVHKLLSKCDSYIEHDKLESLDSSSMSYYFSDRLTIWPSLNWQVFCTSSELMHPPLTENLELKIRLNHGPGRLVGRKIINLRELYFTDHLKQSNPEIYDTNSDNRFIIVVSIFEINNAQTSQELRIVLYHPFDCTTTEYRLSAMEKMMIFKDGEKILTQILSRIRMVYCDLSPQFHDRTLLKLSELADFYIKSSLEDPHPPLLEDENSLGTNTFYKHTKESLKIKAFEVDGDDEYEICSMIDDDDSDEEDQTETLEKDSITNEGSSLNDEDGSSLQSKRIHSKEEKKENINDFLPKDNSHSFSHRDSGWGWAVYFDRSTLFELRGNLVISIVMNVVKKGFLITVFDPRTFYEAFRFITFLEITKYLNKTLAEIEEEISNLDESVVYDFIDELFTMIEVQDDDEEGMMLILQRDPALINPAEGSETSRSIDQSNVNNQISQEAKNDFINIRPEAEENDLEEYKVLARIKEIDRAIPKHPMSRKKETQASYRISIDVLKAKDLARIGAFGSRSAFVIVKYNMREVGRTPILRGTLNPVWEEKPKNEDSNYKPKNHFEILINKEAMLLTCSIDIEVYDADAKGKAGDFLGHLKLNGASLMTLLNSPDSLSYELQKSRKLTEQDNKFVKGTIELKGNKTTLGVLEDKSKKKNTKSTKILQSIEDLKEENSLEFVPSAQLVNSSAYINTQNLIPKFKSFYLYLSKLVFNGSTKVLDSLKIKHSSQLVVRVIFQNIEVHRLFLSLYSLDKSCLDTMHLESLSLDEFLLDDIGVPIECRLIDSFPLGLTSMKFEIGFIPKSNDPTSFECFGKAEIPGFQLKEFLRQSLKLELDKNAISSFDVHPEIYELSLQGIHEKIPSYLGNLKLIFSMGKFSPKRYILHIASARNLANADFFGKSDPFVKIYFNHKFIGQTCTINNSQSPEWNNPKEEFLLVIPCDKKIEDCILELQVYDEDNLSSGDLLGVRILTGQSLKEFINLSYISPKDVKTAWSQYKCEYNNHGHGIYCTLQTSTNENLKKHKIKVQGDVEIRIRLFDPASAVILNPKKGSHSLLHYSLPRTFGHYLEQSPNINDNITKWHTQFTEEITPLIEKVYSETSNKAYRLHIISAKELANADTFGKSDPFVRIWWNGQLLGQTKIIDDCLNPLWQESFVIKLPKGQDIHALTIELEVIDHDSYGDGEFLGGLILSPTILSEMVGLSKKEKRVSRRLFELEKSVNYSMKLNKYVKGNIEIGIEEIFFEDDKNNANFTISKRIEDIVIEEPVLKGKSQTLINFIEFFLGSCSMFNVQNEALKGSSGELLHPVVLIVEFNGEICHMIPGVYNTSEHSTIWNHRYLRKLGVPKHCEIKDCYLQMYLMAVDPESSAPKRLISGAFFTGDMLQSLLIFDTLIDTGSLASVNSEEQLHRALKHFSLDAVYHIPDFSTTFTTSPISQLSNPYSHISIEKSVSSRETKCKLHLTCFQSSLTIFSQEDLALVSMKKINSQAKPVIIFSDSPTTEFGKDLHNISYINIQTGLSEDSIGWGLSFDPEDAQNINTPLDGVNHSDHIATSDTLPQKQSLSHIKDGLIANCRIQNDQQITTANQDQMLGGTESFSATFSHQSKSSEFLEIPVMSYTTTVKSHLQEEFRIYYRGRVAPKSISADLIADEKQYKFIFASRSSRLIRTRSINDMELMADVHYLVDSGEQSAVNEDLPVLVREVISEGPGMITRHFRIEIMTNGGILLGTADIEDSILDFQRVLSFGYFHIQKLDKIPPHQWNFFEIFEYIVKERLVLDMLMGKGDQGSKQSSNQNNRREAIMQSHNNMADFSAGSVISLLRDDLPESMKPIPESIVESDDDSRKEEPQPSLEPQNVSWYSLRIHSKNHRLTGKSFRTLVFFMDKNPLLIENPDYYFRTNANQINPETELIIQSFHLPEAIRLSMKPFEHLVNLNILYRSKDSTFKKSYELVVPGKRIYQHLIYSNDFPFEHIHSKFRRDKLGSYLLSFLTLKFLPEGEFVLRCLLTTEAMFIAAIERSREAEEEAKANAEAVQIEKSQVENLNDPILTPNPL